jgi:hypothetical protein
VAVNSTNRGGKGRTAAHDPGTREKLRRVVEGSLMGVSHLGTDERDRLVRSGFVASQLMGLAMMRSHRAQPAATTSRVTSSSANVPVDWSIGLSQ